MRRISLFVVVPLLIVAGWVWNARGTEEPRRGPRTDATDWSALDAQARCDSAAQLVGDWGWRVVCRWRAPGEAVQGQAFPPPKGAPPYDDPRVEIYVAPNQSRDEVASAIAHELGHMHHTREPTFVREWLAARNLPAETPAEVWTEDYAEVFAALFGPRQERWRAPTPRPSPEALAVLKARFFS